METPTGNWEAIAETGASQDEEAAAVESFSKTFDAFLFQRQEKWNAISLIRGRNYEKEGQKARALYKRLEANLPEKHKNLLMEYEDTSNYNWSYAVDDAFKKGFIDGIQFSKMISAWGEGKEA